nr:hypothetical protein CFP56_54417 [Quercus suber]
MLNWNYDINHGISHASCVLSSTRDDRPSLCCVYKILDEQPDIEHLPAPWSENLAHDALKGGIVAEKKSYAVPNLASRFYFTIPCGCRM